mmetsp:Transcript_107986/g.344753  ORF Transcript_107986/g.344753 Transcript_107986/m.344753 type:complete len:393 (+) Transcript_107986:826-2004(+)
MDPNCGHSPIGPQDQPAEERNHGDVAHKDDDHGDCHDSHVLRGSRKLQQDKVHEQDREHVPLSPAQYVVPAVLVGLETQMQHGEKHDRQHAEVHLRGHGDAEGGDDEQGSLPRKGHDLPPPLIQLVAVQEQTPRTLDGLVLGLGPDPEQPGEHEQRRKDQPRNPQHEAGRADRFAHATRDLRSVHVSARHGVRLHALAKPQDVPGDVRAHDEVHEHCDGLALVQEVPQVTSLHPLPARVRCGMHDRAPNVQHLLVVDVDIHLPLLRGRRSFDSEEALPIHETVESHGILVGRGVGVQIPLKEEQTEQVCAHDDNNGHADPRGDVPCCRCNLGVCENLAVRKQCLVVVLVVQCLLHGNAGFVWHDGLYEATHRPQPCIRGDRAVKTPHHLDQL